MIRQSDGVKTALLLLKEGTSAAIITELVIKTTPMLSVSFFHCILQILSQPLGFWLAFCCIVKLISNINSVLSAISFFLRYFKYCSPDKLKQFHRLGVIFTLWK